MNVQNFDLNSKDFTNQRNIHSIGNMDITTGYIVKDVFLRIAYPNALDYPLFGFGHDIINLSGSPFGNGYGFTVMPHCKVGRFEPKCFSAINDLVS
jgi:hypothetical protein